MKKSTISFLSHKRKPAGYAFITVLVIGLAAALSLLAVADLAINTFRSEAQRRYAIELRNAAEAGVDYAIGQLNTAAAAHQACSIDDGAPHLLPAGYLLASGGTPSTSNQAVLNNMTVTMTVTTLPSSQWPDIAGWSSIYSPSTDFTLSSSTTWKKPATTNLLVDSWRVLTVKAQYSLVARYIRVVLQPRYDPPPLGGLPPGTSQSYFSNVLLGNQGLNFAPPGNLLVQAVTGASNTALAPSATPATASFAPALQVFQYPLTLTTNELTSVGPNTDIRGNVQIASVNSTTNPTAVMTGGTIEGTLTGNSTMPLVSPSVSANQNNPNIVAGNNVVADADLYNPATNPPPVGGNPANYLSTNRVGINQVPAVNQASLSQALTAPPLDATGSSLPDFATNGNTLPAGDYAVSALNTSDPAQFPSSVTAGSASGTTPVRLFVQDSSPSSNTAVNISSNMLSNASTNASNFQIWYTGGNNININLVGGGNFYGTIYAPNATVTTTGNGQFYGAIVAGTANIQHQGGLNLRTDLSTPSGAGPGLSFNYDSSKGSVLTGYKPVTWEEPQL